MWNKEIEVGRWYPPTELSNDDYRAAKGVSSTEVKNAARSSRHWKLASRTASKAFLEGSALHCWVLENDQYYKRYSEAPRKLDKRKKEDKAWIAENVKPGMEMLSHSQADLIANMAEALYNCAPAKELLEFAAYEMSSWYQDPVCGVLCKRRIDAMLGSEVFIDLKTTGKRADQFKSALYAYKYHVSACHYMMESDAKEFCFIVVEKLWPHGVMVYSLKRGSRLWDEGMQIRARGLSNISRYMDSGELEGYPEEVVELL